MIMANPTPKPIPFMIVNAFTDSFSGGNPAAIVFLQEDLSTEVLQSISTNFNQPIITFILPPSNSVADGAEHEQEFEQESPSERTFHVRWFTATTEAPVCGHGSLAAAGAIFSAELVPPSVQTLHFQGVQHGQNISARKVEDKIEVSLANTPVEALPEEEAEKMKAIVRKGLGKDDAKVHFVGKGMSGFPWDRYLIAEIDADDDLANCKINHNEFIETGYIVNVITSASKDPNVAFLSRMFAPAAGLLEDPVCGSAHTMSVPYWDAKHQHNGATMQAKQVSPRGGDLTVCLQREAGKVTLQGEVRVTMKGEIYL
ncbi:unnamed protein product [Somion occarium]|uniref:Diaminopimelate epimerase-like protein n=1 Tax=Somion occarium TaxID=3059160 RepID=A0ABP1CH53_9APHY